MSVWGDLIDALEEQGFGYSLTRAERDASRARVLARRRTRAVELGATLPDGNRVTKRTTINYRYAVAVHVPADALEPAHWEVYRWITSDRKLAEALVEARADYNAVQILEVTTA